MIRVLVAAASPVVRQGLEAIISTSSSLTVVGTSGLATLATEVEALQPDVVLLEWELQDDEPLPIPLTLAPTIVVLADDPSSAWVAEILRSSVRAILPHEATASQIISTVEAVADGLVVMHLDVFEPLLLGLPSPSRSLDGASGQALSPREIEVLGMIAEGLGNKTIARRLGISEHTIKFHIGSIFTKLNASSRTEAVIIGARQGLIML